MKQDTEKKKRTFKIEKGVPIPATAAKACSNRESEIDWPFKRMKKGESFMVPPELMNAAAVRIKREGFNKTDFTTRRLDGGMRIWRIK